MTKEIIVNAGELESRVAILENGRLMELHVEREPKIVGNIYKGRVTKVLKGMDAAFVEIGIERNAFLAASDVIPAIDEESGPGHGRMSRADLPPINQLLHNNQEILVQVVRAPLGTKGARVTTRLSLPGRYVVLMLNSGAYVGVSRKIEDPRERQRLRALANELRPEEYSLIVRTEADGKSEDELRQDIAFLIDMARRIEKKAATSSAPALVHGDLTLIFRLIRDAFTRDVNRLVVDSPTAYEGVLEMVGLIAPRMKNRVFLYDEPTPIFHTYNIEPEIERTLRRKVWLPSGGSLIIDQAEALTAIDVNTGRFVGSIELSDTVLTTNLQAAEEAARQLRLRDLGGIIVVDFIDMDNPKHRQQVTKAFEEALKRDRAKIKVHSISPLGLVEMTRKRTGESLVRLLTEQCPYCSGIGRVQNSLTMALRIERELAATSVQYPLTEAYLLTAHPRVIASMLGYDGEAHRDLELYLEHPIYLRIEDDFHPNAYHLERLTLEQALNAVKHVEEGQILEGQVVNPDPEVSLSPLVQAHGMFFIVPDLDAPVGAHVKVRVKETGTSLIIAEPLAEELRGIRGHGASMTTLQRPPLVPESVLPAYLRDERAPFPPRGLQLLSPTAEAVPAPEEAEESILLPLPAQATQAVPAAQDETLLSERRRKNSRRRRRTREPGEITGEQEAVPSEAVVEVASTELTLPPEAPAAPAAEEESTDEVTPSRSSRRRRRQRRRGRGTTNGEVAGAEGILQEIPADEMFAQAEATEALSGADATAAEILAAAETGAGMEVTADETAAPPARRRRSRRRREPAAFTETLPQVEPVLEEITPEAAEQAMRGMLSAIPEEAEVVISSEEMAVPETIVPVSEPVTRRPARPRRRATRRVEVTEQPQTPAPEQAEAVATSEALPETPAEPVATTPATVVHEDANVPALLEPETPVAEAPKRRRAPVRRRRPSAEPTLPETPPALEGPGNAEASGAA
jgi:ribonuclease G